MFKLEHGRYVRVAGLLWLASGVFAVGLPVVATAMFVIVGIDSAGVDVGDTVALQPMHPRFDGCRWVVVEALSGERLRVEPAAGGESIVVSKNEYAVMDRLNR